MKKTLKRIAPVVLVLLGLAMISFMAKDMITLRLKPQQGKTYTINSKSSMMMTMKVQGQSMTQSQNMETRQTFTVQSVNDLQSVMVTEIEAIKMSASQMGMTFEYDSEHPEKTSPMLAGQSKEFEKTLKKPVTLTYDALGHLVGDSATLEMNQLGSAIPQLPEQELGVGSKWNFNKTQNVSGTIMNMNMEYTVTEISKKSVEVAVNGTTESSEITGTYNGTVSIDPKTGLVTSSNIKQNLSMTVNEQGMTIPVTMIGTTTTTLK